MAVPAGGNDAAISEPLQLVGDRLRPHPHLRGQLTHRKITGAVQGMQKPTVVAQHLEQPHQLRACSGDSSGRSASDGLPAGDRADAWAGAHP